MAPKPSLIFVPGSWHRAETWGKVTKKLSNEGYKCLSITLPTNTTVDASFGDDVNAVQDSIRSETQQNHDVVLVVHSYGGHVGNSAIKGFVPGSETENPGTGRVIGLAMMATGFTILGQTFMDKFDGIPPTDFKFDTEKGITVLTSDPRELFYHDLPEDEGKLWVSKLESQSMKALTEGADVAYPGWKDVPCWYLRTLEDHALPAEVQAFFVSTAQSEGGDVTLRDVQSSHSPMLSQPEATAEFIVEATNDFVSKARGRDA